MDPTQVVRDKHGMMRCRECGFPYNLEPEEIVRRSEGGLAAVRAAVADVPEAVRGTRPSAAVWSVNAYTLHLVEAAETITGRVRAILEQDSPPLPYYDQDQSIAEGKADEQPAAGSLIRLSRAVPAFCDLVSTLAPDQWERVGVHERAGEVSLREIAHDMPHELEHHAMDIRHIGEQVQAAHT